MAERVIHQIDNEIVVFSSNLFQNVDCACQSLLVDPTCSDKGFIRENEMIVRTQQEVDRCIRIPALHRVNEWCGNQHIPDPVLPYKKILPRGKVERCWQGPGALHQKSQNADQKATESDFDRLQKLHLDRPLVLFSLVAELKRIQALVESRVVLEKLFVRSLFHDAAVVKDENLVTAIHCR